MMEADLPRFEYSLPVANPVYIHKTQEILFVGRQPFYSQKMAHLSKYTGRHVGPPQPFYLQTYALKNGKWSCSNAIVNELCDIDAIILDSQEKHIFLFGKIGTPIAIIDIESAEITYSKVLTPFYTGYGKLCVIQSDARDKTLTFGYIRQEFAQDQPFPNYLKQIITSFGRHELLFMAGNRSGQFAYVYVDCLFK